MPSALTLPTTYAAPPTDRLVTGEELLRHPEWGPCELIRGKVVPMCRPNNEHGLLVTKLANRIDTFVELHDLGYVFSGDSGVYLERDPDTVRGPDLHFIRTERWNKAGEMRGYLETPPDLCVEIVSPNDHWTDLEDKVNQYLGLGVKLVWVIDPKTRKARIYRNDGTTAVVQRTGSLSGEAILPGFELPLRGLFDVLDKTPNPK